MLEFPMSGQSWLILTNLFTILAFKSIGNAQLEHSSCVQWFPSSIGLGAWLGRPSSIRKVGGSNPRRGYIPCRCRVTPLPETCCKTTGVFAPHCKPRYRAVAPPYTGNHPWRCTHWLHFPSVCRCRLEIIAKRLRINYAWRLKCGFDVAQLEMCFVHHPWLHPVTVVLALDPSKKPRLKNRFFSPALQEAWNLFGKGTTRRGVGSGIELGGHVHLCMRVQTCFLPPMSPMTAAVVVWWRPYKRVGASPQPALAWIHTPRELPKNQISRPQSSRWRLSV